MSGDAPVSYVLPGRRTTAVSPHRCGPIADALEAVWPGVSIHKLQTTMDCRDPREPGGHLHNSVTVDLVASGSFDALVAAGLLVISDLPAPERQSRKIGWTRFTRKKSGFRLECFTGDDAEDEIQIRIWNAMAAALWSQIRGHFR
jgi:hypothetical protein